VRAALRVDPWRDGHEDDSPPTRGNMSIFSLPIFDRVTRANVEALLQGEALAIWIRGLIGVDQCEHIYEQVRRAPLKPLPVHYTREDGTADYHTHANVLRVSADNQLDEYFELLDAEGVSERASDTAPKAVQAIMREYLSSVEVANETNNRLCAPYRRPCDVLFDHLDETCGIQVAEYDGIKMKFGTFLMNRMAVDYDDPATVPIHVDSVPSLLFPRIRAQLGAMVYCRVPDVGGELRVYDHPLIPRDAPMPPYLDHSYAYRSLKPSTGDAILINSRRPHAVLPGKDDDRLANIMFIGSDGSLPLTIWT
jgi:hypothetical protein